MKKISKLAFLLSAMLQMHNVTAADYYVDAVNGRDANDGLALDSAKKTLAEAMAIPDLASGDIVWVAPGVYCEGTSPNGENRVSVPSGVGLSSLEGAEKTIIIGAPSPATGGIGDGAIRPVYLNQNAWVRGFTLTGGFTKTGANGGGVLGVKDSAIAECIVTNNACGYRGSATAVVSAFRSYIEKGTAGSFTAFEGQHFFNCVVNGKNATERAFYTKATIVNCTILEGFIMNITQEQSAPSTWFPVYNTYSSEPGRYRSYTNCTFRFAQKDIYTNTYDSTCKFDVPLDLDATFRPSSPENPLVNAGDRALYDNNFPKNWYLFKEPYDYAGGWRMCGDAIDIGAGEFQESRPSTSGTIFSLRGNLIHPDRPIALVGTAERVETYKMYLCDPARLTSAQKPLPNALPVSEYHQYAAVLIDSSSSSTFPTEARWDSPERLAQVKSYIRDGGIIILAGKTTDLFAGMSDDAWALVHSKAIICISPSLYQLRYDYRKVPLGEADEQGNWLPTAAGERVEALQKLYSDALTQISGVAQSTDKREWDTIPLGETGTQTASTEFKNSIDNLRDTAPSYGEGIILYDKATSTKAKIYYDGNNGPTGLKNPILAQELAWHLQEMTGETFDVVASETMPTEGPAVYLQYVTNDLPKGTSIFRQQGNILILGGNNAGVSHSLTYLLESLGCRYLWPGEVGKVIPRGQIHLASPNVTFTKTPTIKARTLRGTLANTCIDHEGNRTYYQWHGSKDVNDNSWAASHSFGDYYERFSETHPEWFALQPNGSRKQDLGEKIERPTLCLSSAELAAQKAQDIKDSIAASIKKGGTGNASFSNCLPDGNGCTSQCLCEECRKLDPINAPFVTLNLYLPFAQTIGYPSLSDRVIHFQNMIARDVLATYPGRLFSTYVYSTYQTFPLRERPDPSLVLWMVNGAYESHAVANSFRNEIAKWVNSFPENIWLWRPNALITYRVIAPKNLARIFFNDVSLFKANGASGLNFDNYFDTYASMGLMYYAISKAMLNFDEVNYDVIFNDFCEKGFGPAAKPIKAYYQHQEDIYNEAASQVSNNEYYYVLHLDLDYLQSCLDKARNLASDYPDILARIDILEHIMRYARPEKELATLRLSEGASSSAYKTRLRHFIEEELPLIPENPLVLQHSNLRTTSPARYFYFTGSY